MLVPQLLDHCIDCTGIAEVRNESCSDLNIFRSPLAIAVITPALKVKIKTKITSYQLILDSVAAMFLCLCQKLYISKK